MLAPSSVADVAIGMRCFVADGSDTARRGYEDGFGDGCVVEPRAGHVVLGSENSAAMPLDIIKMQITSNTYIVTFSNTKVLTIKCVTFFIEVFCHTSQPNEIERRVFSFAIAKL